MSTKDYDRFPIYSARVEGRDIARAGLAPYMESVGLRMPQPAPVSIPKAEAPAVKEAYRQAITEAFRGLETTFAQFGAAMTNSAQAVSRACAAMLQNDAPTEEAS